MKGTQLWQGTRSPLIEGRSRRVGPYWQAWLGAAVLGFGVALLAAWFTMKTLPWAAFAFGAVAGSAAGVWFARRSGSRRSWLWGGVLAAVAGGALYAALLVWFPKVLSAMR